MIFYEAFIRSRLTYACQTWTLTVEQFRKLDSADVHLKRRMINNGFRRRPIENDDDEGKIMPYVYYNEDVHRITKSSKLSTYIKKQRTKFAAHIIRCPNTRHPKQLMFNSDKYKKSGNRIGTLLEQVVIDSEVSRNQFIQSARNREF